MKLLSRIALVVSGLAACERFDSGPSEPAGSSDPTTDSGAPDGPAANDVDAGGTFDASPASDAGDGGGPPCARYADATFCDDFEAPAVPSRWRLHVFPDGGGSVDVIDGGSSSASALGASILSGQDVAGASILLRSPATSHVHVRGDFRIPSFAAGASDYVMVLTLAADLGPVVLAVRAVSLPKTGKGYLSVVNEGSGQELSSQEFVGVTFADWTPVDLDVVTTPFAASLQIGASRKAADIDASAALTPTTITLNAGAVLASSTSGETRVLVDNLAVWIE